MFEKARLWERFRTKFRDDKLSVATPICRSGNWSARARRRRTYFPPEVRKGLDKLLCRFGYLCWNLTRRFSRNYFNDVLPA